MVLVLVKTFHSLPPLLKVEAALLSTKHLPCCTAGTEHARVQRGAFALTSAKPLSQTQKQSEGVHLQIFLLLATNHSSGRSQEVKKINKKEHIQTNTFSGGHAPPLTKVPHFQGGCVPLSLPSQVELSPPTHSGHSLPYKPAHGGVGGMQVAAL